VQVFSWEIGAKSSCDDDFHCFFQANGIDYFYKIRMKTVNTISSNDRSTDAVLGPS